MNNKQKKFITMKRLTQILISLLGILMIVSTAANAQTYVYEGFEGSFPPSNWTIIDGPCAPATNPSTQSSTYAYQGTYSFRFSSFSSCGSGYDAYLITPLIAGNPDEVSFYYRKYDYGSETFRVGYSITGNSISDFVWETSITNASTTWQQYLNTTPPAGVKYVAIHYQGNYDWYLYIDEFYVKKYPAYDAGIVSIDAPVAPGTVGPNAVEVTLQNFGIQTLTSATIQWEVNGTAQTPFSWTGSLATGATAVNVNIGNANLIAGFNVINAWVVNPNGQPDEDPSNDAASTSLTACAGPMTGSYTIGSGGDFPSFSAAVATLETCGVGGPVNFYAFNGTYNEQVSIPEITGASASNTITFQSLSGNAAAVVLNYAPAGSTDNFTLELDGADYITFQNMTLQTDPGNSAAYGRVIEFASSATFNMISNCIIKGREISTTSNNYSAIYASSSLIQNNVVTGNQIQYGTYAIYWNGSSSSSLGLSNIISNNTVSDFSYYGLRIYYQDACIVDGNTFTSAATYSTVYGIYAGYCDNNSQIVNNQLYLSGTTTNYGIHLTTCDGVPGQEMLTANNYVYVNGGAGTIYGIYSYNGNYNHLYHNTILMVSGDGSAEYAIYANSSSSGSYGNASIKNNILMSQAGGYPMYISTNANTLGYVTEMDYNNLFTPLGSVGRIGTTDYTILADWQTASGFDANSLSIDPVLTSATNPKPVSYAMDNKGTPLAAVPQDMNGLSRSLTTPDIGCVEYVAPTNPIMVLSDTAWDFGLVEEGTVHTKTLYVTNVGPSALIILNNSVSAPYSCNLNASGFKTILSGQTDSCIVTFAPTAPGVYNHTLSFVANTTVLNLSMNLKGEAYATGSLLEDFEGPVFPPPFWTLVEGPCYPTNEIILNTSSSNSVSPTNSLRLSSWSSCAGGYEQAVITPELITTATNRKFSFWYKKSSTTYAEEFVVGWSSTGNNLATDFTWDAITTIPNNTLFHQYVKTDLPIGTKYVAIKNLAAGAWAYIYIDDVFGPPIYYPPYALNTTIVGDDAAFIGAGSAINYRMAITNLGTNNDVFNLSTSSAKGYPAVVRDKNDAATITSIAINNGETDTVIVKITVPAGAVYGDIDTTYLTATSQGDATRSASQEYVVNAFESSPIPMTQTFEAFPNGSYTNFQENWYQYHPAGQSDALKWQIEDGTTVSSSTGPDVDHTTGTSTGKYMYLETSSGSTGDQAYLTTAVDLTGYNTPELRYWYHRYGATMGDMFVQVLGNGEWITLDTLTGETHTSMSDPWTESVLDLSAYGNQGITLRFIGERGSSYTGDMAIDDVSIFDPNAVPGCASVVNPADSAVDVLAPNQTLEWSTIPNTSGYNLYFGTTNPPPFLQDVGDTNKFDLTGLAFNTQYFWKIVPYNAIGNAAGCEVWNFTTIYDPTIRDFPYIETFDLSSSLPTDWISSNPVNTKSWGITGSGSEPSYGPEGVDHTSGSGNMAWLDDSSPSGTYVDLTTPPFDLTSFSNKVDLSFWYWIGDPGYATYDSSFLVVDIFDGTTWHDSVAVLGKNFQWDEVVIDLVPYISTGTIIRFRAQETSSFYSDLAIDDVSILGPGIVGQAVYANAASTPLGGVQVDIPAFSLTTTSDNAGVFGFMPVGTGTYNLVGSSTEETGGINTTDALWAARHFVSLSTLTGLPLAAADVNGDAVVNAMDAQLIQQYYVEMINTFAAGMWQFDDPAVTVSGDVANVTLTGIAIGDVNASYTPATKVGNQVLLFSDEELQIPASREVMIPVYAAQAMEVGAVSIELTYPAALEILDISSAQETGQLMWNAANGKVRISWMGESAMEAIPGSAMFYIKAIVSGNETIVFRSGNSGEFADGMARVIDNAAISIPKLVSGGFASDLNLTAYPNPTAGLTTLAFQVSEAGNVSLRIFNTLGEEVAVLVSENMQPGSYQTSFDVSALPAGVYFGTLQQNELTTTIRIVAGR